jgi:hypothetical protein
MNRIEVEAKLGRDRAKLIELFESLGDADLARDATPSEHESSGAWNAKDHLAHLAGIEKSFNRMIRRHLEGDAEPVALRADADGKPRSREQVMAAVHESNEEWVARHRTLSLSETVAAGQQVRSETLALLAELSDEQLLEKLPGAPWADGTIGGVLAVNGDHGRVHWSWLHEGLAAQAAT